MEALKPTLKWQRHRKPRAARAVANAIGKNPFAPKIPCHRVIRSDGSLGGYSGKGGVKTKRFLLKKRSKALELLFDGRSGLLAPISLYYLPTHSQLYYKINDCKKNTLYGRLNAIFSVRKACRIIDYCCFWNVLKYPILLDSSPSLFHILTIIK